MPKPLTHYTSLLFAFLTLLIAPGLRADDAALTQRLTALEQQVTTLKAENKALRATNEQLRQKLAAAQVSKTGIASASADTSIQAAKVKTAATGYWLKIASNKRHNSACRYYQNSKGRACGPDEGVPCKICGG